MGIPATGVSTAIKLFTIRACADNISEVPHLSFRFDQRMLMGVQKWFFGEGTGTNYQSPKKNCWGILGHELHARLESHSKVEPGATKPWSNIVVSRSFCGWQRFSMWQQQLPHMTSRPSVAALAAPWFWKRAAGSPGPERVAVKHGKFLDVKPCPLHQRPFHEQTCRHE